MKPLTKSVSSFLCALMSVFSCVFFFGQPRFSLPLALALGCVFALVFAGTLLVLSVAVPGKPGDSPAAPDTPQAEQTPPARPGKKGFELFQRAARYMEEQRPFLDDKMDLDRFSRAIYSNKVYVSKAINYYSGKNFRQFLNWHRIQHAIDLMKKDPHLRMEEVSILSGFHSTVSFNMSFRLFQGKTPTQWHEEYVDSMRSASRASLSRNGAPEP